MNKKGDVTINTIIVAVLAIIVLVVLAGIFTGRIKWFGEGVEKVSSTVCSSSGGVCLSDKECPAESTKKNPPVLTKWSDCIGAQICCAPKTS